MKVKIALISSFDVKNKRSWSGTQYRIWRSLSDFAEVTCLGPVNSRVHKILNLPLKIVTNITGKRYILSHSISVSKYFARIFETKIKNDQYDLIFAPAASTEIAFLETRIPTIYLSDTTFTLMVDYYEGFSNLSAISKRQGELLEARALGKANRVILPSKWAADSAQKDYCIDKDKISVIPFGANIDKAPDRSTAISRGISTPLQLLFLGASWSRKGGPTAYRTTMELNRKGIDTSLTVCGCTPPPEYVNEKVQVIPFLDKSKKEDIIAFNNLLLKSHFLILPTKAECFGIVFCEAAAFGLPVIATRTGGVPYVVDHNTTGILVNSPDDFDGFVNAITDIAFDGNSYEKMVYASRDKYEQELNWDRWTEKVKQVLDEVLYQK